MDDIKHIVIVACNRCHSHENEDVHYLQLLIEMEDGNVYQWEHPSRSIVKMFERHKECGIVYQSCDK